MLDSGVIDPDIRKARTRESSRPHREEWRQGLTIGDDILQQKKRVFITSTGC